MKKSIKTNLKLAGVCATAMMTLSGCVKRENVIENIGSDKILLRDVTDDKQRIIEGTSDSRYRYIWDQHLKYSHIGDTVILKISRHYYNNYDKYKCFTDGLDASVNFNNELHSARREQAKFDSLKCAITRENQEKQR